MLLKPVHKKPSLDPLQPKSYRPISKRPFMSKILEKVVAEQLTLFLENHELFDKFQSGCATGTGLLKVSSDIMMSADSKEYTVLVLLDQLCPWSTTLNS